MKQLLILSGKGGTGKTTIASAFIRLANAKAYADCDVDAPNLHLVTQHSSPTKKSAFYGMDKAYIDTDNCISCGICEDNCRFNAISQKENLYQVNYYACEGCGVCEVICPTGAVSLKPAIAGDLIFYNNNAIFSTAQLRMGSGNSGKLVTEVKEQMKRETLGIGIELAIIDGSPGIGCPVIASLNGVDMVLVVAEPSLSGISDMKRIIGIAQRFQTKTAVCVNKYDINLGNTAEIESFCKQFNLPFVGKIPFDSKAIEAINNGLSIVEIDCVAGRATKEVFAKTIEILNSDFKSSLIM